MKITTYDFDHGFDGDLYHMTVTDLGKTKTLTLDSVYDIVPDAKNRFVFFDRNGIRHTVQIKSALLSDIIIIDDKKYDYLGQSKLIDKILCLFPLLLIIWQTILTPLSMGINLIIVKYVQNLYLKIFLTVLTAVILSFIGYEILLYYRLLIGL